jgi:hypothetical protein
MANYAGFQQSVYYPNVAYAGDYFGLPPYNPTNGYIVDANSYNGGILIGTFAWGLAGSLNNSQVTQIKGSNTMLAGFAVRAQDGVWADANVPFGYSMLVPATRQIQIAPKGSFYAVAPSLNGGGVIVQGDIILVNNTTGALASQTSSTIPSGYTQAITGGVAWTVINVAPTSQTASGYPINNAGVTANLVVISNIATY